MAAQGRGGAGRPAGNRRAQKPTSGYCKLCGDNRLVFKDDGSGFCTQCNRVFRWDGAPPGPQSPPPQPYGRYDNYPPPGPGNAGAGPHYPVDQSYARAPERRSAYVDRPSSGVCKNCQSDRLEFYDDGAGLCRKCGRVFNWREAEAVKQSYGGDGWGSRLYSNREEIKRALDTGAKPSFVLSALVHQGMDRDYAYNLINDILDELSRVKSSQKRYIDDMIRSFEEDEEVEFRPVKFEEAKPRPATKPPDSYYAYDDDEYEDFDEDEAEDEGEFVVFEPAPDKNEDEDEDEDEDEVVDADFEDLSYSLPDDEEYYFGTKSKSKEGDWLDLKQRKSKK